MSDGNQPLVSCLMPTLPTPARLPWLRRSLGSYCRQSYPNRELVIVVDQGADEDRTNVVSAVATLARSDIRVVVTEQKLNFGQLRNLTLREARGDLLCQWDDDDYYHPDRIGRQLAAMRAAGGRAICLQEIMLYFPSERRLYLLNLRGSPTVGAPQTMLWERSLNIRYAEEGRYARGGTDVFAMMQIRQRCPIHYLAGEPYLFLYTSHGANLTPEWFRLLQRDQLSVSKGILMRREAMLRAGLAACEIGPDIIEVHGSNGLAFSIAGPGAR